MTTRADSERRAPDLLRRAVELLRPYMDANRRDTWLTQAYFSEYRTLYDAIDQNGAPADFTPRCVRILLDAGCRRGRHVLSLLLEEVSDACGEDLRPQFDALIAELDGRCEQAAKPAPPAPSPISPAAPTERSVFISYAREDARWARRIQTDLEQQGHACWVDTSEILGGDSPPLEKGGICFGEVFTGSVNGIPVISVPGVSGSANGSRPTHPKADVVAPDIGRVPVVTAGGPGVDPNAAPAPATHHPPVVPAEAGVPGTTEQTLAPRAGVTLKPCAELMVRVRRH